MQQFAAMVRYRSPKEETMTTRMISLLNRHFQLDLSNHDLTFEDPFVPDEKDILRNSCCWVLPSHDRVRVAPGAFYYDRLNLSNTMAGPPIVVSAFLNECLSTGQIAVRLSQRYGVELSAKDVVDEQVFVECLPKVIELKAKQTSMVWMGSVQVILDTVKDLGPIPRFPTFLDINPPGTDVKKKAAAVYSWDFDLSGTALENVLSVVRSGQPFVDSFTDDLSQLSNDPWVYKEQPAPFNLYGSYVLHNGSNSAQDVRERFAGNPHHNYVVAVLLSHFCTNLSGVLLLGYGN